MWNLRSIGIAKSASLQSNSRLEDLSGAASERLTASQLRNPLEVTIAIQRSLSGIGVLACLSWTKTRA
jgi:hypothetical protein